MDIIKLKKQIISISESILINKLEDINKSIKSINDSAQTDTKSTAGDKHETFKALMHYEQEKLNVQKSEILQQLKLINQIKPNLIQSISLGAIVKTDLRNFFLGLPIGKIKINEEEYFSVSINSPIVRSMNHSQSSFTFNSLNYKILSII